MSKTLKLNISHFVIICAICACFMLTSESVRGADEPMPVDYGEDADTRRLKKPVIESRLLDDMENPATWSHRGRGKMSFTSERCKDGKQSIRITSPTKPEPDELNTSRGYHGRGWYSRATLRRNFPSEDWNAYNRLSFWVYPTLPGFQVVRFELSFHNDGGEKLPGLHVRERSTSVALKPDRWNHVVWEIPHLTRNKVTAVEFAYQLQGSDPGAATTACYELDHLELQKVEADHYEGWNVARGRIAFSHTGYPPGTSKTAIASDLSATSFKLVNAESDKTVLSKPIQSVKTHLGQFQVLDFSEVKQPGTYVIQAGDVTTRSFRIGADIWKRTIWKVLNFFYCERCGFDVPGIHKVCHADWQGVHGDKRIIINGGWHDAADLSQGLENTSQAAYAMFSLAEELQDKDPKLARRLIEEACWGLDWVLKTHFGDGFRINFAPQGWWTDGVLGTPDDMEAKAQNRPLGNYLAAGTEALAARLLKDDDPGLAARCLKVARDDWRFAVEKTKKPDLRLASAGALASMELFHATGEQPYADRAIELADVILDSQQREVTQWEVPLVGFFYTGPGKSRILHHDHLGREQAPVVALARLCSTFPDHPNWMKWYSAVVLHSEYLKSVAGFTAPYGMLPASVYRLDESSQPWYRPQVEKGIRLAENYYLRLFPVWGICRGNHGTLLSQTKALSTAARLRGDPKLIELCQTQLQWIVGRNPFAKSTMYGEGYDYAPLYGGMSGNMVGALPVGIETRLDRDVPYWPHSNGPTYKEVWVHPPGRWLWIMQDLAGTARVIGQADAKVEKPIGLTVSQESADDGRVTIRVNVQGTGRVRLAIRTHNLKLEKSEQEVELKPGKAQTLTCTGRIPATKEPWVAVIVPNGSLADRKEVIGGMPPRPTAPR